MVRDTEIARVPSPRAPADGGVHLVASEGRFPLCGSWRSNWNRTVDPDRATCPHCLQRLIAPPGDTPA
jgi:hypothetical protein